MKALEVRGLKKSFLQGKRVVADSLELEVKEGEILALLGESGCGKSTFLRMVAGFETPEAGEIYLGGEEVFSSKVNLPPAQRAMGIVFQNFALFPHLSVAENIAFGAEKITPRELEETLEKIGMAGYGAHYPHELSGGQQQRVALARALALKPKLILLDEPFSSLDRQTRRLMREELRRLIQESGVAALLVTHDRHDAFSLADSLALMKEGKILQRGTPRELYFHPHDLECALFLGEAMALKKPLAGRKAGSVVRPEWFRLSPRGEGILARVQGVRFLGVHQEVLVEIEGESLALLLPSDLEIGAELWLNLVGC